VLAAVGGLLVASGQEGAGVGLLVFTAVRAGLGVVALLFAHRALDQRHPADDRPSAIR
jgi:hypothetical protein